MDTNRIVHNHFFGTLTGNQQDLYYIDIYNILGLEYIWFSYKSGKRIDY